MGPNEDERAYCCGFLRLRCAFLGLLFLDVLLVINFLIFLLTNLWAGEAAFLDGSGVIAVLMPFRALIVFVVVQVG
jgi:hypothetical protein